MNTDRKLRDWTLNIYCKFLIIGDFNLSRFPHFREQDLQIDSYPGGNFHHAANLLTNATYSTELEVIVLAFGINHRLQKARGGPMHS